MTHPLALLAIVVYVRSNTIVNAGGDNYFAIIPKTCAEDGVGVSTTPVACMPTAPAVDKSTGPFVLRAVDGTCRGIQYFNPNGSTVPPGPIYPWATCPQ